MSQALDLLKIISAQKNSVFGQFDLIGAAIEKDDTAIISEGIFLSFRELMKIFACFSFFCVSYLYFSLSTILIKLLKVMFNY